MQRFRRLATVQNPPIQMMLPMAGVGDLLREAGWAWMQLVMEEEVRHWAGPRQQQHPGLQARRWGKEDGYGVVERQKVPIRRTACGTSRNRD